MAAAVTLLVVVWTVLTMRYESEPLNRTVIGWALIAVGCGALYFRRRAPVAVAVVTLAVCVAYYPLSVYDGPLMATFALVLYTAAAEGRFTAAVALAVVTLIAVGFGEARRHDGNRQIDDMSLFMLAGWLVSLVAVGRAQWTRAARLREVEQRALAAERKPAGPGPAGVLPAAGRRPGVDLARLPPPGDAPLVPMTPGAAPGGRRPRLRGPYAPGRRVPGVSGRGPAPRASAGGRRAPGGRR
ncbi:hypothetical protein ACFXOI_19960 [Streptomyces bacillaris]|uniref:DUF7134 domain-containing protein n=1 Tax=Streptomyces bacillaris TaxID=68179 RepID=UPI0036BB4E76